MLDILGSWKNLAATTQAHFETIRDQKEFERIFAVQFELAYSDFRTIQMALQLAEKMDLLKRYTQTYNAVYAFEYAYVAGDLAGFNERFGQQLKAYEQAVTAFLSAMEEVKQLQPADDAPDLV